MIANHSYIDFPIILSESAVRVADWVYKHYLCDEYVEGRISTSLI